MRTLFSVVGVGALALGISACSQDLSGPSLNPQYSPSENGIENRHIKNESTGSPCPEVIMDEAPENAKAHKIRENCTT